MATPPIRFRGGLNNDDDPSFIDSEQLARATGSRYSPDSDILYMARGRTVFNQQQPGTGAYRALSAFDYNEEGIADLIVVQRGQGLWSAPVGTDSLMKEVRNQKQLWDIDPDTPYELEVADKKVVSTKVANVWLLADGTNPATVMENNGRARNVGLLRPSGSLTVTEASGGATVYRADTHSTNVNQGIGQAEHQLRTNDVDGLPAAIDVTTDTDGRAPQETYEVFSCRRNGIVERTFSWQTIGALTDDWAYQITGSAVGSQDFFFEADIKNNGFTVARQQWKLEADRHVLVALVGRWADPQSPPQNIQNFEIIVRLWSPWGVDPDFPGVITQDSAEAYLYDVKAYQGDAEGTDEGSTLTTGAGIRYAFTEIRDYERILDGQTAPQPISYESALSDTVPPHTEDPISFPAGREANKIEFPTQQNELATHWGVYRSVDAATAPESLSWDRFTQLAKVDIAETSWIDRMEHDGFPLDFQDATKAPPFLFINNFLQHRNLPPPTGVETLGTYKGSALYGCSSRVGQFFWSVPLEVDAVPDTYTDFVPGRVNGFMDLGSLLVFTNQSVSVYQYLPLATELDFSPYREGRVMSRSRGLVSRRGLISVDLPGAEKVAIFVSTDGIYGATPGLMFPMSTMLEWPITVSVTELTTAELIDDPTNRRIIMTYEDNDGLRQALDFYYRPGGELVATGPRRWPKDGTTAIYDNNDKKVYSMENGIVYLENSGVEDAAHLESPSGTITFDVKTPDFFPYGVGNAGRVKRLLIRVLASNATLKVTYNHFIDQTEGASSRQEFEINCNNGGWYPLAVDPNHQKCESFNLEFWTQDTTFAGLSAMSVELEEEGQLNTLRIARS